MSIKPRYIEKEISWLSFNERVLQEATNRDVPIIERLRFLGIFSNNLDEFFKVRFADVKRRILIDAEHGTESSAKDLLRRIQEKSNALYVQFDKAYIDILKEMARRRIYLIDETQIDPYQYQWLKDYFKDKILPHISPIMLNDNVELLDFLHDEYTYLSVGIHSNNRVIYSLLEIPTEDLSRFIQLPEKKGKRCKSIILIDNIIRLCLDDIFKSHYEYDHIEAFAMKMTRDAEYDLNTELDASILENMSASLNQRLTALPVRFVYEREMPKYMVSYLIKLLKLSDLDSVNPGSRYQNFKDFIDFPNVGPKYLEYAPIPSINNYDFMCDGNMFNIIKEREVLLYYPYHTFRHMTEWLRQAAYDPKVRSIKINIYRVAKHSRIIKSVIDAANNGKRVTVIVELQARFDEEANIKWSRRLTEAGIKVLFGTPGLKIHSKLCLITRQEGNKTVRYAHIGTGNFNEKTAKIYTDFSLLTANEKLTNEVRSVFNFIENPYRPVKFDYLMVSPQDAREKLYALIDREIRHAKSGKPAAITAKINNLVDPNIIDRLYLASAAGVKIRMIVRGMCSLMAGVKGLSDNIYIISIVDRLLEHPRVFIFENDGKKDTYISSADWMTRNIDRRIEVGCPIFNKEQKKLISDILDIQFEDRVKARIIDIDMRNNYVPRGNKKKLRSQLAIHNYIENHELSKAKLRG